MKVLVAEDDPAVRGLLAEILGQDGHDVILAEDGQEAWEEYRQAAPEVVIADWMMPRSDGLELCRRIRTEPANPYTYIVVVTGRAASADALEAMKAGADDHLAKPFTVESLEARMVAASRLTLLHQGLAEEGSQLRQLTDGIPALANGDHRRALIADLESLADRTRRYGHRYWLAVIEIDRLDRYRTYHGGEAAENVTQRVAEVLQRQTRTGDSLHSLGGDQFLLVLPEQDDRSVQRAAARLRRAVEAMAIPHVHNLPKKLVTVSMGLSVFERTSSADIGQTLFAASELAIAARRAGGDVAMAASRHGNGDRANGLRSSGRRSGWR
jgi:two-component system chemotaxis response regulator CheY